MPADALMARLLSSPGHHLTSYIIINIISLDGLVQERRNSIANKTGKSGFDF